jgi:hypothetical protein
MPGNMALYTKTFLCLEDTIIPLWVSFEYVSNNVSIEIVLEIFSRSFQNTQTMIEIPTKQKYLLLSEHEIYILFLLVLQGQNLIQTSLEIYFIHFFLDKRH